MSEVTKEEIIKTNKTVLSYMDCILLSPAQQYLYGVIDSVIITYIDTLDINHDLDCFYWVGFAYIVYALITVK